MTKSNFTFIDLFSGIGGFRMALGNNGGKCLNFSEINTDAINTYCINFNEPIEKNLGDITSILRTSGILSYVYTNLSFDAKITSSWT